MNVHVPDCYLVDDLLIFGDITRGVICQGIDVSMPDQTNVEADVLNAVESDLRTFLFPPNAIIFSKQRRARFSLFRDMDGVDTSPAVCFALLTSFPFNLAPAAGWIRSARPPETSRSRSPMPVHTTRSPKART